MTDEKSSTKICTKCLIEKPLNEFNKRKKTRDGKSYWCKNCLSIYQKDKYRKSDKFKGNRKQFIELIGMKYVLGKSCPICSIFKERTGYSYSHKTHDLLKQCCKECEAKRYKKHRNDNLEKYKKKDRINHYIRKYGIDKKEAEELEKDRTGICEICNLKTKLVVDHCHKNGHVRGKICTQCNSALGYAKDSIMILKSCIGYLIKDSKRS